MEDNITLMKFEDTEIQVIFNNQEIEMDINELAKALGYGKADHINQIISRNPELQNPEFSAIKEVINIENGIAKRRKKRFFTEQGIYEVTFLANTERGKNFRRFARMMISKFKKNELNLGNNSLSLSVNKKLDEVIALILTRDEEIGNFVDFILEAREKFVKVDTLVKDMLEVKKKIDEIIEGVNEIIDEVYGKE